MLVFEENTGESEDQDPALRASPYVAKALDQALTWKNASWPFGAEGISMVVLAIRPEPAALAPVVGNRGVSELASGPDHS